MKKWPGGPIFITNNKSPCPVRFKQPSLFQCGLSHLLWILFSCDLLFERKMNPGIKLLFVYVLLKGQRIKSFHSSFPDNKQNLFHGTLRHLTRFRFFS